MDDRIDNKTKTEGDYVTEDLQRLYTKMIYHTGLPRHFVAADGIVVEDGELNMFKTAELRHDIERSAEKIKEVMFDDWPRMKEYVEDGKKEA